MNIILESSQSELEPVAILAYTHLVFKGENGEAVYFTSDMGINPPPNTGFVHKKETWEDLCTLVKAGNPSVTPIYPGDKVTIEF